MSANRRYKYDLAEILGRVDLEALFDEYGIASKGSGHHRRFSCPAPEHQDADPSTSIGRKANGQGSWKCWSGDHRGDALDLVKAQNPAYSNAEAIEFLAGFSGVKPLEPGQQVTRRAPTRPAEPTFVGFAERGQRYVQRCHAMLDGDGGERQRQFLVDRGISMRTARANLVGADPGFMAIRRSKGLPAGTVPGVTFPALGPDGSITYVQLRSLPEQVIEPGEASAWHAERGWVKYDNPSRSLGSNPKVSFAICPDGVTRSPQTLIVTEGIPDGLIAAQMGFRAVAILGNQTPDGRAMSLVANVARADSLDVVIAVDADPGGVVARRHLRDELTAAGIVPAVAHLPDGLDLNDWALTDPNWAVDLEARIGDAQPIEAPTATPGAPAVGVSPHERHTGGPAGDVLSRF